MDPRQLRALRDDLDSADYRVGAVTALLGPSADAARARGLVAPARYALAAREPSALTALVGLFLVGTALTGAELARAFPRLGIDGATDLGLVATADGMYRAALSLNPVEIVDAHDDAPVHWWLLSDLDDQLRHGPAHPDHVMGVGGATRSLIAQAPPVDADSRCLDLGTGCGIVAMHLARAGRVVATDISERALTLARANAELNGVAERIEFRHGDLFAPVARDRFDAIVSNPPFVITPRDADTPVYAYRDGGMAGDGLAARVVREAPEHLAVGGTLVCLANWETPWGGNGLERVTAWVHAAAEETGALDAWIIERDRIEPLAYAETWARDGGARPGSEAFEALLESWLRDFSERRVVSIGLGSIRILRRGTAERTIVHADHAVGAYAPGSPAAGLAAAFAAGATAERMTDAEVLATHWFLDDAVVEEREHRPGEEAPSAIALRTDRPIARRVSADPLLAAAVGACDGDLTLAQIADALAEILQVDAQAAREALVSGARELAWLGMLAPARRVD